MEKSEKINELIGALVAAQTAINQPKKDSKNPFFGSDYASLNAVIEAVKPALNDNGIYYAHFGDSLDGKPALTTFIGHVSGQWISATTPLIAEKTTPQGYGSALTYFRRYFLQSALGVNAEKDDDANHAEKDTLQAQIDGFARKIETVTDMASLKNAWTEFNAFLTKNPISKNEIDRLTALKAEAKTVIEQNT